MTLQDICNIIAIVIYHFICFVIAVDCETRKHDVSRYIGFSLDEKPSRCPRCRFRFLRYVGDR